jgi:hypothetical protein
VEAEAARGILGPQRLELGDRLLQNLAGAEQAQEQRVGRDG